MLPSPPPPLPLPSPRTSTLALWSLGLGVAGLLFCVPSLAGIACATIALIRISNAKGFLQGKGIAVAGLIVSIFGILFPIFVALVFLPTVTKTRPTSPVLDQTLAESRRGFVTKLIRQKRTGFPVPEPPAGELNIVHFRSPVGDLPAYLSPIPHDGKKHPAIIWLTGGFSNSIGENAWASAPPDNDQTARVFRQLGVVTMYPSYRGGNENPGFHETLLGEVDDVLAAADFLAAQPNIDRIYLGGHSTGGTLALLVAETSPRFRAVFAFGPVDEIANYGRDSLTFDPLINREHLLRDPISWLHNIKNPTFVFEGEDGNIESLRALHQASTNRLIQFFQVKGKDHFDILAPYSRDIATQIRADTGPTPNFVFPTR